jgi:hypothetical protein
MYDFYLQFRRKTNQLSKHKHAAIILFIALFIPTIVFFFFFDSKAAMISFTFFFSTILLISYAPEIEKNERLVEFLRGVFTSNK